MSDSGAHELDPPIRTRNAVRSRRLAVGTSEKVHEYKNDERGDCSDRS